MSDVLSAAAALTLQRPRHIDREEFLRLVDTSRPFHAGLVEPPASKDSYDAYVRRVHRPSHAGFLVRLDGRLVGVVNVNNILRGSLQSASLGYYRLACGGGRALMPAAVGRVVDHVFAVLGLHRLEANVQPSNRRSIEIVAELGFRREGFSPAYLRIGGVWRDHERWALTTDEHPGHG